MTARADSGAGRRRSRAIARYAAEITRRAGAIARCAGMAGLTAFLLATTGTPIAGAVLLGGVPDSLPVPRSADEIRLAVRAAERAPVAEREDAWYRTGRLALRAKGTLRKEADEALDKVRKRLGASGLAALSAINRHPAISEGFALRMLERGLRDEAAAECRDAIAYWGPSETNRFSSIWKRARTSPDSHTGGAVHSVFRIGVMAGSDPGTDEERASLLQGFRLGLEAGAGSSLANRFILDLSPPREGASGTAWAARRASGGAGLLLVVSGERAAQAASAAGAVLLIPVLDARVQDGVGSSEPPVDSVRLGQPSLPSPTTEAVRMPATAFDLRVPGFERGRRLAAFASERLTLTTVALAVPEVGGDRALAAGFSEEARRKGATVTVLEYPAGRRNLRPEAERFRSSGARALLLAGSGEEAGEWLLALAATRQKPLVLGSDELDPAGFHERIRTAAEGAVFIASQWQLDPTLQERMTRQARERYERDPDDALVRGVLLGHIVGRAVAGGAITPALLRKALEASEYQSAFPSEPGSLSPPAKEARLPIYRVQRGVATAVGG